MTAYLFLATARAPFGEALCGLDVAMAAHGAGDRVAFLHHSALTRLFANVPFSRGTIDVALADLPAAIRGAVASRGFDIVVLVDALSVLGTIGPDRLRALIATCGARVVALDLWSCHETSMVWDVSDLETPIDRVVLDVPALRPAPVARPEAPGAYRALPAVVPASPHERARIRDSLAIGEHERVVVTTVGSWQLAEQYPAGHARRLADAWPALIAQLARRLAPCRLVHVGPAPFVPAIAGYRHFPQLAAEDFRHLLAASDLLLTGNIMATSIAAAIALDVPVLALGNSVAGATLDELEAGSGAPLTADARAWVAPILPLRRFAVSPLGLHAFVAPVLARNPYRDAVGHAEALDFEGTAARARALLDDATAARSAMARYRTQIAALPGPYERLRELTNTTAGPNIPPAPSRSRP